MVTTKRASRKVVEIVDDRPAICVTIRTVRKELGLSMGEVARRMGVAATSIVRWENGERTPSLDTVERVEAALGLERGYLLRHAGYVVERGDTVDEAIASDPALSETARAIVLSAYQAAKKISAEERRRAR